MKFSLLLAFVIVLGIYGYNISEAKEPVCSKFAYEEQLLEKMIRTEIKVETMVNEIMKIENNVISTLGDIKQTVADFTKKFANMREDIMVEMQESRDDIQIKEESFKTLFEETRNNLTGDMEAKRNALDELRARLERPPIAFHAHHVKDLTLDTSDEILIFEKTFVHEGTGYDTSTGKFTAPAGGLYQFIVHVCAHVGKYAFIGIVLEGKCIAAGEIADRYEHTCGTVGAIVRVRSGQQVWVKSTSPSSNRNLHQDSYRMNTFGGLLVNN